MYVDTLNLTASDEGGMVPLNPYVPAQEPTFIPQLPVDANLQEKNINNKQIKMDSTPISDLVDQYSSGGMGMMEPPAMSADPRMQSMSMNAPQQYAPQQQQQEKPEVAKNNNPFNLTDDQMEALLVGVCAVIAISKPVQEKLASSVPRFANDMGGRSAIGLASTGAVAAVAYFIFQRYVFKK